MRTILFGLTIILNIHVITAQPKVNAVLLKNKFGYKNGDTISLLGHFPFSSNSSNEYITKSTIGNLRIVSPSLVKVIDTISDFWDKQWFYERSGEITRKGLKPDIRNQLQVSYKTYHNEMKVNGFLVEDSGLLDYLNQIVENIGPQKLYKGYITNITVHVIKADQPDIFSFDNGGIFITTQMLSNTKSEDELIKLLTTEMAHIILDHQFLYRKSEINTNTAACIFIGVLAAVAIVAIASNTNKNENNTSSDNSYYETESLFFENTVSYSPPRIIYGPPDHYLKYTSVQNYKAQQIAKSFKILELNKFNYLSQNEYTDIISPAITYTAWNLFFKSKYKESLALLNQIENVNTCGSDDYLLKAKNYRKLYNTEESNYEALKYLQMAKEASTETNIDILKEEGLIYFQLNNMDKARASFEEYKLGLTQLGILGEDDKKELQWVNSMLQKTKSAELNTL